MGIDWFNCKICTEISNDYSNGFCCCCGEQICEYCCEYKRKERLIKPPIMTDENQYNDDTSDYCCYGEDKDDHDNKHGECCFKIGCILCYECDKMLQAKKEKLDGKPDTCVLCNARKDILKTMKKYKLKSAKLTAVLNTFCNNDCELKNKEWLERKIIKKR